MSESPVFVRRVVALLFTISFASSHSHAFSEFDGVCGDAWIFVSGKYKKYYDEIAKKTDEYYAQCRPLGSMTDARFACDRKVHEWREQSWAARTAQEKADGEAYDAKRQQCINQAKTQKNQKESQEAAQRQQEQLQRKAYNDAMTRSNEERDSYNRAAEQKNRQAQEQYAAQQRAYTTQQTEANRQAQIQTQQQATVAAEKTRKDTEFRSAVHDLQMETLQRDAQDSGERYAAAAARNESVSEKYEGQSQQLSDILAQVRVKAAAKLAAAKEAITGNQPALRGDVGEVVATTLVANVALNNQNPISNGLTGAAITGMGQISSSALNQVDQVFAAVDAQNSNNDTNDTSASGTLSAQSGGRNALTRTNSLPEGTTVSLVEPFQKQPISADQQQEIVVDNPQGNIMTANEPHVQNIVGNANLSSEQTQQSRNNNSYSPQYINNQSALVMQDNTTSSQRSVDQNDSAVSGVSQCATPNIAQIQADLPPYALASMLELRNRLDIAIDDYKLHCKKDPAYQKMIQELNQAREQTQTACAQLASGGKCQ